MTRPRDRLRALCARLCSRTSMERLVDPILSDLQTECAEAVGRGWVWRRRWVLLAGYAAFARALLLYGSTRCVRAMLDSTDDDRAGVTRTIAWSVVATGAATLLLVVPPWIRSPPGTSRPFWLLYLIPQALAVAVPVGFTSGVLFALGGRVVSRRLRAAVLALAIGISGLSLLNLGWIIPAANQAFRVSVMGRAVAKGPNELTLSELGSLLEPGTHEPTAVATPADFRHLAVSYHLRWALSFATLALAIVALSMVTRRQFGKVTPSVAACGAGLSYYGFLLAGTILGRDGTLPPVVGAWLPNVVVVVLSAVLKARPAPPAL